MCVFVLLLAAAVNNDSAIKAVIKDINAALSHHDEKALAEQFTPGSDLWMEGRQIETSREGVLASFEQERPWSDTRAPALRDVIVVSIAAAKAVVHADEVRTGPLSRVAALELILVHRNEKWLVDSVRVLSIRSGSNSPGAH